MKLQSVQALRGIAALLVVLVHGAAFERMLISENGLQESPLISGLFLSGYGGVDLFFVISGFIMVWVTRNAGHGAAASADFLFARLLRVYPLWWMAAGLMVVYALNIQLLSTLATGEIAEDPVRYSQAYLAKSFLLIPQFDFPVLAVGWTLVHEVYFYAVFALLMLLPRGLLPWALLVWGGLVVSASLIGLTAPTATNHLTLAAHPMTMEFIFGAAAALIVTSGIRWRGGLITLFASLWLTSSLCLQGPPDAHTMLWGRVLLFGLPCTALVYGVATLDARGRAVWLVPAAAGALVCGALFQFYGVNPDTPTPERLTAIILPLICGALTMGIVLWAGWLGGQNLPGETRAAGRALEHVHRGFIRTGDWSYSVYLLHLFVLGLLKWGFSWAGKQELLAPAFRLGTPGLVDNALFLACTLTGALLAGWLGHRLIERPIQAVVSAARTRLFHNPARA
ncbi:acyltransferase family protein [Hyphomonas sp.]|uniref:acyltransferase family protein n=1 Tax=Hyphomonas sp. TaxID=87 RepID=UPI00391B22C1